MSERKAERHASNKPYSNGDPSRYISGLFLDRIPWTPFVIIGIVVSILGAIGISIGTGQLRPLMFAAIFGLVGAVLVLQRPELGAYLLIVSVFSNASDLLTERGLPGINKPLIALTMISVLANYLLRTGKYSRFPQITRVEWALMAFYSAIVLSMFRTPDPAQVYKVILDITKDILVGVSIFITLNTRERLERGMWIFIITITFLSALGVFKTITGTDQTFFGLAQLSAFGQVGEGGELRYSGPIGEPNLWGQVLVSALPLILYRFTREKVQSRKIILAVSMFMVFLAGIYTSSRGASVALLVVVPLMALELRVKPLYIVTGLLSVAILLNLLPATYTKRFQTLNVFVQSDQYAISQEDSFIGRKNEYLAGLAMFRDHFFLGVGFGNYGNYYWEYAGKLGLTSTSNLASQQTSRFAHSLYIEILSEIGLLGLITFATMFGFMFSDLATVRKKYKFYKPNSAWVPWLTAIIFSIITFLVSGIFLHGLLFRYVWMLIGFSLSGIAISKDAIQTFRIRYQRKHA